MSKISNYTSGNLEIDSIRCEVKASKTCDSNHIVRGYMLKQWACALQQCGMYLDEYVPIDIELASMVSVGHELNFIAGTHKVENEENLFSTLDDGYKVLERIQKRYHENGMDPCKITAMPDGENNIEKSEDIPWAMYQGNFNHTGVAEDIGALKGEIDWTFPVGLAWYVKPVFDGDRVYLSSPGMRSVLYCMDRKTGAVLWTTKQVYEPKFNRLYSVPGNWSTPIVLNKYILIRQLGSRGAVGIAKHVVLIDKENGEIIRQIDVGHMDYRAGWTPLAANEHFIYTPSSEQFIENTPALSQPNNRIICRNLVDGDINWSFNAGSMFADPVLSGDVLLVATQAGTLFCLDSMMIQEGNLLTPSPDNKGVPSLRWQFQADAAINNAVFAIDDCIYFGANDGKIYSLSKTDGSQLWEYDTQQIQPRAFKQFSQCRLAGGKLYVGDANGIMYCLDADTGTLIWNKKLDDWIRSAPAIYGNYLYVSTMGAQLYRFPLSGNGDYDKCIDVGEHPILADLTQNYGQIYVSTSDLQLLCFDEDCNLLWSKSAIDCFESGGRKILTDQIAGGAYYQSKASAADGLVYFGSPARFVYALDAISGIEAWRFEMGAAISACPSYDDGKIYVGQQGGEDEFYCLDAKTGIPKWTQSIGWVWGSANISNGRIFIPAIEGFLYCLDGNTGHVIWRYRTVRSICSEPVNDDGMVYVGSWDHFLYAFDELTGKLVWQFYMGGASDSGVQLICDGKLYLPMGGNKVRCLDGKSGEILWQFTEEDASFNASLAYNDDRIYLSASYGHGLGGVATQTKILCLDCKSGSLLWKHNDGGGLTCASVANGKVYFGATSSPYFYCIDELGNNDGTTDCYFRVEMEGKLEEICPAIYKGRVYMLNSGGYFYSIK